MLEFRSDDGEGDDELTDGESLRSENVAKRTERVHDAVSLVSQ